MVIALPHTSFEKLEGIIDEVAQVGFLLVGKSDLEPRVIEVDKVLNVPAAPL